MRTRPNTLGISRNHPDLSSLKGRSLLSASVPRGPWARLSWHLSLQNDGIMEHGSKNGFWRSRESESYKNFYPGIGLNINCYLFVDISFAFCLYSGNILFLYPWKCPKFPLHFLGIPGKGLNFFWFMRIQHGFQHRIAGVVPYRKGIWWFYC